MTYGHDDRFQQLNTLTSELQALGMKCMPMVGWRPGPRINYRRFFWDPGQFDFRFYCDLNMIHFCHRCEEYLNYVPSPSPLPSPCYLLDQGRVSVVASHAESRGHGFILCASTYSPEWSNCLRENRRVLEKHKDMIELCRVLSVCS